MLLVHPSEPQIIVHSGGLLHVLAFTPTEMRALADDLRRRADETEAGAKRAADVLLGRIGGTA